MSRDKFLTRLMIPILNKETKVVGFTGRILPGEKNKDRPKYLNSPESEIFKKGEIWYGWPEAISVIRREKWAILVEGNMDVIAAHRFGLFNVIASQGTSVTQKQIQILKQSPIKKLVIAFDNDTAGQISSQKLFKMLAINGFEVLKLKIPGEFKDLDEFLPILSKTVSFVDIKIEKLPAIDYLQGILDNSRPQFTSNKPEIIRVEIEYFLTLLSGLKPLICEQYLSKLSMICGISISTLDGLLSEINKKNERINAGLETINTEDSDSQVNLELKFNNNSTLSARQSITVSLQKLITLFFKNKLQDQYKFKIHLLFDILKHFRIIDIEMVSLQEYIAQNKEILELTAQNTDFNGTIYYQINAWNVVINFIDLNRDKFLFEKQLKEKYTLLKTRV